MVAGVSSGGTVVGAAVVVVSPVLLVVSDGSVLEVVDGRTRGVVGVGATVIVGMPTGAGGGSGVAGAAVVTTTAVVGGTVVGVVGSSWEATGPVPASVTRTTTAAVPPARTALASTPGPLSPARRCRRP